MDVVARAKDEIAFGARVVTHAELAPPAEAARVRRFLWGFALPFGVLRATLRDPVLRKRWLQVTGGQLAIVAAVSFFALHFTHDAGELLVRDRRSLDRALALLASIYTTTCVVEWIVVFMSREYHDELSLLAAGVTRVPGEPLLRAPRVDVDLRWLWTKLKRRLRGYLLIASGAPLFAFAFFVPLVGDALYGTLLTAWSFYWLAVFAVASTPLAWLDTSAPPPWYLRPLLAIAEIPVIGAPARWYASLWSRVSRSVHPACAAWARAPYEGAGLAVARAVTSLPGVYLFLRPVFAVAATHALVARPVAPPGGPAGAPAAAPPAMLDPRP